MLAVGITPIIYGATAHTGYSVIFDGDGKSGTTFGVIGDTTIDAASNKPFLTFDNSFPVSMNGNVLTNKAVPVSMTKTSYILDQVNINPFELQGYFYMYPPSRCDDFEIRCRY